MNPTHTNDETVLYERPRFGKAGAMLVSSAVVFTWVGNMGMILFGVFIGMSAFVSPVTPPDPSGVVTEHGEQIKQSTDKVASRQIWIGALGATMLALQIGKMAMDQRGKWLDHKIAKEREDREDARHQKAEKERALLQHQVNKVEQKTDVQTAIVATIAKETVNGSRAELDQYLSMYDKLGRRPEVNDERDRIEGQHAREDRDEHARTTNAVSDAGRGAGQATEPGKSG